MDDWGLLNMTNKELIERAKTEFFIQGDASAIDRYWSDTYIQHNPTFANGRDEFRKAQASNPNVT